MVSQMRLVGFNSGKTKGRAFVHYHSHLDTLLYKPIALICMYAVLNSNSVFYDPPSGGGRRGGGVGRHFTVPQMIPKENWDWVAPKLAGHHVNFIITKSHIKSEILLLK